MAHEIKLAGPWEFSADDGATWLRCTLPFQPAVSEFTDVSRCQLRRKFHRPSGLETSSRVFVRLECDAASVEIRVNDAVAGELLTAEKKTLSDTSLFDVEVTSLLQQFNTLTVSMDGDSAHTIQAVRVRIVESVA